MTRKRKHGVTRRETADGAAPAFTLAERTFDIVTEAAAIVFFDPRLLRGRRRSSEDWCTSVAARVREANAGRVAWIETGADGSYRVRVTAEAPPTPVHGQYRLQVESGWLHVGPMEDLPSIGDPGPEPGDPGGIEVPPGEYRVEVRTPQSPDPNAPCYVVTLSPWKGKPPVDLQEVPRVPPADKPAGMGARPGIPRLPCEAKDEKPTFVPRKTGPVPTLLDPPMEREVSFAPFIHADSCDVLLLADPTVPWPDLSAGVVAGSFFSWRTSRAERWRVRIGEATPGSPVRASGRLRLTSDWIACLPASMLGAPIEPGNTLTFPHPKGRYLVRVRTPPAADPHAPDYAITLVRLGKSDADPQADRGEPVAPAPHPAWEPPDPEGARTAGARYLDQLGRPGEEQELRRIALAWLECDPHAAMALFSRSCLRQSAGDLAGAISDLRSAVHSDPMYGLAWNNLAWWLLQTNRAAEALPAARRAVELDPIRSCCLGTHAEVLHALGRSAEAATFWAAAVRRGHPDAAHLKEKIRQVKAKG